MSRYYLVLGAYLLALAAVPGCDDDESEPSETERESGAVESDSPASEDPTEQVVVDRDDIVEIQLDESALEYLRPICGEDAKMTDYDEGHDPDDNRRPVCPALKEGAEQMEPHRLTGGYVGDFSGDGNNEAILNLYDTTTTHPLRQYRTAVLQEFEEGWDKSFISDSGLGLGSCEPVQSPQHDWLVCSTVYVRHGVTTETWNLNFVDDGERDVEKITELADQTAACRLDGEAVRQRNVDRIEDVTGDGNAEIVFGIESKRGEPVEGFDPDELPEQRCERDNYNFETIYELDVWKVTDEGVTDADPGDVIEHLDDSQWDRFVALPEYYPTEELTADEIENLSLRELSLMRNTIFARAGQEFSTDWIAEYFDEQDWYQGGGLDDGKLSELDHHNVQTLLDVGARLSETDLRDRRLLLWRGYGGIPDDGKWSFPGPFEQREDAIESMLVDEALDDLLETTGAFRRPSDPGDIPEPDETLDVPDQLGPVSLGGSMNESQIEELEGEPREVDLVGDELTLYPVVDLDGKVEQIVGKTGWVHPPMGGISRDLVEEGREYPERRLNTFTTIATNIAEAVGQPSPEASSGRTNVVWKGDERTLELDYIGPGDVGIPDVALVRVVLRTNDPERICGDDDGFDPWYDEFMEAMKTDDPEEAVDYFEFPFVDSAAGVGGVYPEPERSFDSPEEFLQRETLANLRPADDSEPVCLNHRRGYGVLVPAGEGGGLHFERVDGSWRAVRIALTVRG